MWCHHHYTDVIWAVWRLKLLAIGLFFQKIVQDDDKAISNVRKLIRRPATGESPFKKPVMRNVYPWHDFIMMRVLLTLTPTPPCSSQKQPLEEL